MIFALSLFLFRSDLELNRTSNSFAASYRPHDLYQPSDASKVVTPGVVLAATLTGVKEDAVALPV